MARDAQDREDLLRDATAFVPRVQLRIFSGEESEEVFVGFRAQGAASIYFDQDPVFHFNSSGELRRAFVDEVLIKAERGQLVALRAERSAEAVTLRRHTMSVDEQQLFCQSAMRQLHKLQRAIAENQCVVVGHVDTTDVGTTASDQDAAAAIVARLAEYLQTLGTLAVAASPRVGG